MKLSPHVIATLKNFSTINDNFYSSGEESIKTKNVTNNMMALVQLSEEERLPEFGIYKLTEFLGVVSLFDDPDFDFKEDRVIISSGKSRVSYRFADKSILDYPQRSPKFTQADVSLRISEDQFKSLIKASGVLGGTRVTIRGNDGTISVSGTNSTDNEYAIDVDNLSGDFEVVFDIQYIKKMVPSDYHIQVTAATSVSLWENKEAGLQYFVGTDKTGTRFGV